ncbi:DMT family transporter [Pseudothauera nasutitermitis]|uniref:DMT family transporter n=1 Tax=Pseudothauera nasutitermitis TaxID=2565930 RepID=A0A4S4B2X6_9RHOO|nr:DMT family transporter [Pseudothauera nasutitermitis]THF67007.1 DMT family transporter [Pseudothauera nasutitermitis]
MSVSPSAVLRSIVLLLGALFLFVLLDATAKHLAQTYPVPMLVWARYAVHLVLMVVLLGPSMRGRLVSTGRPVRQVLRAFCLLAVTFFSMAALARMPLAETTALLFAAPLLVTLMARPILGEQIGAVRWTAVLIGFAGVLMIARPGSGLVVDGVLLALGGAVSYASYQIMTRQLTATEHPVTMVFYTALVGTAGMSVLLPWIWAGPLPTAFDALLICSLGVYGGAGHFLLTRAFRDAPASTLTPILYVQLAWAALVGWLVFGDFPDGLALTGILVIGAAGALIALHARRAGRTG